MDAKSRAAIQRRIELSSEKTRLRGQLDSIEQEVGLRDSAGIAQYQPIFWDEVRKRYLAITPPDKRRLAIKLYREMQACTGYLYEADLTCARLQLLAAEKTGSYLREIVPPIAGVFFVWLGAGLYGVTGAIAGAVVGIFGGFSYIREKEEERRSEVEIAREAVAAAEELYHEHDLAQELFTESDEVA